MSEFKLIIGNKNYSSWSLRPWICLKHMGVDFEEILVPLNDDNTSGALESYFSNGKVPVLQHNGFEIWDSMAIIEYLGDLFPGQLLPADIKARAVMRSICAEMHSSFTALRNELPMNCRRRPSPVILSDACLADIERIQILWLYANQFSDGLDHGLLGTFSMADAMYAPVILRFHRYCVPLQDSAASYVNWLLQHPAMIEWIGAGRTETQVIESEER